ncbi:hypothetical protein B6259_01860 [Ruminococcaceae bacterium CPB6]|uniref:DUF218 domain-containing protein n=2 Tax=Oscillospiraceae TaxID=216572 RepID=A0ABX6PVX8_9FIRM|nr:hypothetical protein B6259_01860 [Ruminococcaceae bacterium CPB6]QKO30465.1 hypothetical protein GKP14_05225 [Caproicibacterium lactatifermentans]
MLRRSCRRLANLFSCLLSPAARLRNGFLFDLFLDSTVVGLFLWMQTSPQKAVAAVGIVLALGLALLLLFGISIVCIYLFTSAIQMLRKERHTLPNMLSLLLIIGIFAQIIAGGLFGWKIYQQTIPSILFSFVFIGEFYLLLTMISFLTVLVLLHAHAPRYRKVRCLIVLGCGLLHGSDVSPMLAGRIDRAIRYYRRAERKGCQPFVLLSGGQGADEALPEGEAMYRYAQAHGIPEDRLLKETQSKNTEENLRFSREVLEQRTGTSASKLPCLVISNNYHIYRAVYYAKKAGLKKARGLGCKTAPYYFPNAVLREYLAVMVINRRFNIAILIFSAALQALLIILSVVH